MSSSGYCSAEAQDFNILCDGCPSCHRPTLSAGPLPECQKPENVGVFSPGLHHTILKEGGHNVSCCHFYFAVDRNEFKISVWMLGFFLSMGFPAGGHICCTDHLRPHASLLPCSIPTRRREGVQPMRTPLAGQGHLPWGQQLWVTQAAGAEAFPPPLQAFTGSCQCSQVNLNAQAASAQWSGLTEFRPQAPETLTTN